MDAALRDLYQRVDTQIAQRGPTCWASGKCCKFDEFGHRLYVTGLEIAWFLQQVDQRPDGDALPADVKLRLPVEAQTPGACPYQRDGLCSTHTVRPLGCRIFFCQKGTEDWQQDLYEQFLTQLRTMHDERGLEYRYMDWIAGLDAGSAAFSPGG